MKPKLFDRVALLHDVPEQGLMRGDVATLVDLVPHPNGGPEGAILEVFNALGESINIVTVPVADIEALSEHDFLSVRHTLPV